MLTYASTRRAPVPGKPHIMRGYDASWGVYAWHWCDTSAVSRGEKRYFIVRDEDRSEESVPARAFIEVLRKWLVL